MSKKAYLKGKTSQDLIKEGTVASQKDIEAWAKEVKEPGLIQQLFTDIQKVRQGYESKKPNEIKTEEKKEVSRLLELGERIKGNTFEKLREGDKAYVIGYWVARNFPFNNDIFYPKRGSGSNCIGYSVIGKALGKQLGTDLTIQEVSKSITGERVGHFCLKSSESMVDPSFSINFYGYNFPYRVPLVNPEHQKTREFEGNLAYTYFQSRFATVEGKLDIANKLLDKVLGWYPNFTTGYMYGIRINADKNPGKASAYLDQALKQVPGDLTGSSFIAEMRQKLKTSRSP